MGLPPLSRELFQVTLIDSMSGTNLLITGRPGGSEIRSKIKRHFVYDNKSQNAPVAVITTFFS